VNILIPDHLRRNVLAAMRSLGRNGHRITLAIPTPASDPRPSYPVRLIERLCRSRYCGGVTSVSSPLDDIDAYVDDVLELLDGGEYDVVLPFGHSCVGALCYAREAVEARARLPFGDFSRFMAFHDKWNTLQLAQSLEIPIPETFWPRDQDELAGMAPRLTYPVVVKARIGCGVSRGVRYARNAEELLRMYSSVARTRGCAFLDDFERPLVQEYVPGRIHDVATLSVHGRLRGALTQMRQLTYPAQGGIGAVNMTTNEPQMLRMAASLLEAVKWHGPALVEFKLDSRDGTYRLLEVNPKFWGTTALSIRAGIDFPSMACQMAVSGDIEPVFDYRVGLTYRWLAGEELLSVAEDRQRMRALWACLGRFFKPDTAYDFSPADPMPDVRRLLWTMAAVATGRKAIPASEDVPLR
jgi:predicted ATP-grasp superfamily ATP-dependent carboligase